MIASRCLSLACAVLCAFCLRAQPASAVHLRGAWEGKGTPIVEDFKDSPPSRTYLLLHSSDGDLKVFPANPAKLLSGTHRYRVEGTRTGRDVVATSITPLDMGASSDTCTTTGDQKTIALLVNVPGALAPTFTAAQVQDWLFGSDLSLNGYVQDASYGQTSASGVVSGFFNLTQSYTADQLSEVQQVVFEQAATQGIDLTQYSRIMLFLPSLQDLGFEDGASSVGCFDSSQGSSNVHASVSWILEHSGATATDFLHTIFHEFGHGLGLDHSTSLNCGIVSLGPNASTCQTVEYGDPYSVMGNGNLGHYTAPQKYALGWIQDANVTTVTAGGTVTLQPLGSQTTGIRALRTPRTVGGTDWLWMELREPVGPYESTNFTSGGYNAGVVVHFQPQSAGGDIANLTRTQMVDIPPAAANLPTEAAVGPGGSWPDVFSGLSMSVAQSQGSTLGVTVSRNSPCFTLSSSTATVAGSGGTGTVQVSAPSSCSWSASASDSWLTIQNGGSGTGNGTVTFLAAANTGVARQSLLMIGGQGLLISQPSQNLPPGVVPMSPSTVTGPSAFLNFMLTDNTPNNYSAVSFNITSGPPGQPVCMMAWDEPNHQFVLTNDDGIGYSTASDSSYLIDLENSSCAILIASPSFYGPGAGTEFSLQVEVVWKNPTAAPKTIYLRAQDLFGNDTGWQNVGTWTTTVDQPPSQPALPNVPGVGLQHLFTIEASDPDGAGDIQSVELDIGSGAQRCSIIYTGTIQSGVEFLNDDGTRSGWVTNTPATASNSLCSLDLLRTGSTTSGNTETVLLPVTFLSALGGEQPVQVIVTDWSGETGTLNTTWNVAASSAPAVISAGGIVNGASFVGGNISAGEIVTIFGSGLGPSTVQTAAMVAGELEQTVAGTTVFFNGTPAPLIYASESAVSAIVPLFLGQNSIVVVASNGGISAPMTVPLVDESPGIFLYPNSQQAVAVNQDGSFNKDTPAARGAYITFYITGGGDPIYNNASFLDIGGSPPSNPWATTPFPTMVQFGNGTPTPAAFAGLTYTGVFQINAIVDPNAPTGDAVPLRVLFSQDTNFVPPGGPPATIRIQ